MTGAPFELPADCNNPLDMIEEMVSQRGWNFNRSDDDYLIAIIPGLKEDYEVCLEWQEEFSALLMACSLPVEIAPSQFEVAARTIEQINQNMWMGHFDLSTQGKFPTFRQTFLFRMIPTNLVVDIVHDALEVVLAECNRFITTFQLVQAGDTRLQDNLHAAVFETVGEA